jgi:hypothetical protein
MISPFVFVATSSSSCIAHANDPPAMLSITIAVNSAIFDDGKKAYPSIRDGNRNVINTGASSAIRSQASGPEYTFAVYNSPAFLSPDLNPRSCPTRLLFDHLKILASHLGLWAHL